MKKFAFQSILLLIAIAAGFFLFRSGERLSNLPFVPQAPVYKQLLIASTKLKVEIADTQSKRSKGLGGRQSLATEAGMLFIFDNTGKHPFWMKGLTFPLDFVWIKGDKVVDISPNVAPPTPGQQDASLPIYQSKEDVDKVLEINAGTIQGLDIKVGDIIKIE
ncbi:hypothetical protein A3I48_00120 [Candidatus Daviesbacteria bacterium RIFCSPLOWO2_02_FULL_36_7]|uniref:DUF192 domain-containing protein n=1 Tax=Candidatus Daviesbacteria bacterium RIFCSPLOWO2_02_FULL_36_7 TaxID=1797792 RepID=A0A1F5MHF5_9BACT|nr:MAG: hypothetical protein A3I48_00120 [Candidatus Daviesbacteria bacterium RIFCSPLOWO2_02_FULL_36_7]